MLHEQVSRGIAGAQRLRACLEKQGGYPTWDADLVQEAEAFVAGLSDNQRTGRLLGKELGAGLGDPR